MRTRRLLILLVLFASGAVLAPAGDSAAGGAVRLRRVYFGWRDADSFKRIAEYFDGREHTGGELILRTHPQQRSGYYFLTRLARAGGPLEVKVILQVITPESATPKIFRFSTTLPAHDTVLDLGLTGGDWPDRKVNEVAWKIDVLGADDQLLASATSYLWAKPTGG